jgi:hypothetical protein
VSLFYFVVKPLKVGYVDVNEFLFDGEQVVITLIKCLNLLHLREIINDFWCCSLFDFDNFLKFFAFPFQLVYCKLIGKVFGVEYWTLKIILWPKSINKALQKLFFDWPVHLVLALRQFNEIFVIIS